LTRRHVGGLVLREGATAPTTSPLSRPARPEGGVTTGITGNTVTTVKTHKITTFWRKRRPVWGLFNTAAPIGASVFRAGGMMRLPRIRISKSVTITSPACPQAHFAGVATAEAYYTPGFYCGRSGD